MNSIQKSCLLVVCFLLSNVSAEVIRQPPGLKAGDPYHLAFITSGTRDSSSTDIEDYNAFVQDAADSAPEVGDWGITWYAVGATDSVSVAENTRTDPAITQVNAPTYLLDGSLIRSGPYNSIWTDVNGSVLGPWDISEFGKARPHVGDGGARFNVMTGFDWGGDKSTFPLGSTRGITGGFYNSEFGEFWFFDGGREPRAGNQNQLPMYAFSELLIAVPEPTGNQLLMMAFVAFVAFVRRK